jgi:hypothetical protein
MSLSCVAGIVQGLVCGRGLQFHDARARRTSVSSLTQAGQRDPLVRRQRRISSMLAWCSGSSSAAWLTANGGRRRQLRPGPGVLAWYS